jgi:predicted transcriptional regulator
MIEQLFGSKTRVKLLRLFYGNPNRSFYVREITRKIDEQINSVRRELANLLSIGIISSDTTNNRLYYEVNQSYEYYKALQSIFGEEELAVETSTVANQTDNEHRAIKSLGNIDLALYTGQFTRDETAGIDFMLVGDVNQAKLNKFISELEAKEGKEIRYTVMSLKEFRYRDQIKDRFLANVMEAKKQILVDKHGIFSSKQSQPEEGDQEEKA